MVHEPEASLEDRVEQLLVDAYGESNVTRQFIYDTDRRVDLFVQAGIVDIAIECESNADSVVAGAGQAILYANHDRSGRTVPVVVVADGHAIDEPEREFLEGAVAIYEESELAERLSV